ncbi:MAG: hypothetical protein J5I65_12435 [Aridibacter famidurans]|nr:hypothetical protein [Aridibacter famidurans]
MAIRLKTLLFVLLMTFSVYAAAPAAGGADEKVCPMKCCKKAKADAKKAGDQKYLCRVLICAQSTPAPPNVFSPSTIAPVLVEEIDAPGFDTLFVSSSARHHEPAAPVRGAPARNQPIFIQINSLLI